MLPNPVYDQRHEKGNPMIDSATQQQAIVRLFDLVRTGDVDNLEFSQLDSLVYGALEQTYQVTERESSQRIVRTTAL